MSRQYVAVRFSTSDRRTYTYQNDGEPVAAGDAVIVETARGEATVTVDSVSDVQPPFATKPIVGRAPAAAAV